MGFSYQAYDDFVQNVAGGGDHYKQIRRTLCEVNSQQHKEVLTAREMPTSFVLKLIIVEGYIFEKDDQILLATPIDKVS